MTDDEMRELYKRMIPNPEKNDLYIPLVMAGLDRPSKHQARVRMHR